MRDELLASLFQRVWTLAGDRPAIVEGSDHLSFRDLLAWSEALSGTLEGLGCQPGHCIALLFPNSSAFVAAFAGATGAGAVVAPLSVKHRVPELSRYLADIGAAAVLAPPALTETVVAATSTLELRPAVVEVRWRTAGHVAANGRGRPPALNHGGSPPLLVQQTSGSTGLPKYVVRTHAALLGELRALHEVFEVRDDDRFLGVVPFCHVNGLVRTMLTAASAGCTLYVLDGFHRRRVLDMLRGGRITFFGAVPQIFVALTTAHESRPFDLSSLRVLFSSSAPLLPQDNHRFHRQYHRFIPQLYGSTETGTITFNRDRDPERRLRSVGAPLPGVRVEVVDDTGAKVPPGAEGEIVIGSPFLALGHLEAVRVNEGAFRDGRHRSGDLGVLSADGHLTITGRKKFVINHGGFKINPYEVEEVLLSHSKVVEAVVFATPGSRGDDVVTAQIVASAPCTAQELARHCRERLADFKVPRRIRFGNQLPRSPAGKVLRHLLPA